MDAQERIRWFEQARFGMFIHWGLYAVPARGEWVRCHERIPNEQYEPYFQSFNPTAFDPRAWARLARQAGMRYAVLTAKHHDGFCLFDSALTDYKSTNTPCGRDLVREYLNAFRAEGLKVGLYYSLLDWHHPDYPHMTDLHHPMRGNPAYSDEGREFDRYLAYLHGQVRELLTQYGKLDILWFDFSYDNMTGETWRASELMSMVRALQPWVVVDNRLGGSGAHLDAIRSGGVSYAGDFASPEQTVPPADLQDAAGRHIPWEACMTLNDNWGYCAADRHYKSARMLIRTLVECVSKSGNLLLNVGPDATGRIPEPSVQLLQSLGRWTEKNGASIYGCEKAALPKPDWGRYTQHGNRVYAHILEEAPGFYEIAVPPDRIQSMRLLADGSELRPIHPWNALEHSEGTYFSLPGGGYPLPDEADTVVEILIK